jgi:hypothetical protein
MRASSHRSCRDNDRSPISMRVCARARCRSCDSCSSHHQSMRLRPHHTTSERKLLAFPLNSSDHLSSERDRAPNGNAIWLSVRVRPSRGPAGSAGAVRTRGPRYQPRHCCTQPAGGPTSPTTCGAWGQAPSCIRRRPGRDPPLRPCPATPTRGSRPPSPLFARHRARGPGRAGGRGAPSKQRRRGPSSGRRAVCCACQIIRVASRGAGAGAGRAQAAASSISRAAGAGRSGSRASVPAAHCTALRLSLLLAYWQQLPCVPMAPHLRYPLSIPCSRVQRRDVSGAAERASLHGGLGVPSRRRRYLVWPLCARGEEREDEAAAAATYY